MQRCLLVAASVLVVSIPLAAQESVWSGTMTAGKLDSGSPLLGAVIGYNRYPVLPTLGEITDPEFDLGGTTYRIYVLLQVESHPTAGEWSVGLLVTPRMDHRVLESMTLTLDGKALHVSDALEVNDDSSDDPPWTEVAWADPGFRWTDGQRVDAELTMAQPVPALPLAAAGLLASLLALGAYRRVAGRTRPA